MACWIFGQPRAAFDPKSFDGAVAMVQFEPDEVTGLGEGQNTTLHPMADRARADLEVLRHLCSRPPLLLRPHGFDCCIFRHANMFGNNSRCAAMPLPLGPAASRGG